MSLSYEKVTPVKIYDPTLDFKVPQYYGVLRGGQYVSYNQIPANNASNQSSVFSCDPPSPHTAVDRWITYHLPVTITFTGNSGDPNQFLLQSGFDAFRAFPISNIIESMNVSINGNIVSLQLRRLIDPLMRYQNDEYLSNFVYAGTPSMLDQTQLYDDITSSVRNPLAPFFDSNQFSQQGRGAYPMTVTQNSTTTAVITADLYEPMMLSPMYWGGKYSKSFYGIQNLNVVATYISDLSYIWSHSNGSNSTIDSITVTLGTAELFFKYYKLPVTMEIPKFNMYPYDEIRQYITPSSSAVPLGPLASDNIVSRDIKFQTVPRNIYIYVRRIDQERTFLTTDSYMAITRLIVSWDGHTSGFSQMTQYELWQMCLKNGYNMTWNQFSGLPMPNLFGLSNSNIRGAGSVICLKPGRDLGLSDLESPGCLSQHQFRVTVEFFNPNPTDSITPQLEIIEVDEGICSIFDNRCVTQVGVLNASDVLDSETMPGISYNDIQEVWGHGDFIEDVKKGLKDAWKFAKDIGPDVLKTITSIAPLILAAAGENDMEGDGIVPLGGMKGGALLSRDKLKKRMK